MVCFARVVVGLLLDAYRLVLLLLRSSAAIRAENLVLRKQLAQYIRARGQADFVTHISLVLLTCSRRNLNARPQQAAGISRGSGTSSETQSTAMPNDAPVLALVPVEGR